MTFDGLRVGGLRRVLVAGLFLALGAPAHASAQSQAILAEGYITPSDEIAALVASNRHESVLLTNLSPDATRFLNSESEGMPSVAQLARPYHRLAGIAIDPAASRSRNLTTGAVSGLELIDATTGARTTVQVPGGARVSGASWSPDGSQVAFLVHTDTESHAWVADVSNGRSRQVTRTPLLATRVTGVQWSGDGRYLFAVVAPARRTFGRRVSRSSVSRQPPEQPASTSTITWPCTGLAAPVSGVAGRPGMTKVG